jgi:transcriptional regulator with XRE-family HTH domain
MRGAGERFKEARLAANMTQEEVAIKAGCRRATVSDFERGVYPGARVVTVSKLCEVIGADHAYIVNGWRCSDQLGIPDIGHLSQADRIEYKLDVLLARTKHLEL